MKSKILKTEFKNPKELRDKVAGYMRERRRKIKLGLIVPEKRVYNPNYQKEYQRKSRQRVIEKYGGKCECCGIKEKEFLAIDHIKGGGRKHRKIIGGNISRWLIMNDFPDGYRILCHNCNCAKGIYGYCPHDDLLKETLNITK